MSDVSTRFDRLPETAADRDNDLDRDEDERRPTREAVLDFWAERFGVPPSVFAEYTFWERGKGKVWAFADAFDQPSPVDVQGLGLSFMRTRREHWKPTTDAVQRFGRAATKNVVHLSRAEAEAFMTGEDQDIDWDGDWGYLVVTHDLAGEAEPIGVGLYVHGELRSQIPKGRQRDL